MKADWISVNDRLPTPNQFVLVSQSNGKVQCGEYFLLEGKYVFGNYGWEFANPVIAWAELPEPYEVKE